MHMHVVQGVVLYSLGSWSKLLPLCSPMIRIDCDDVRVVQLAQGTNLSEQPEGCYLACDRELTSVEYVLGQRLRIPDSNLLIFFFFFLIL